MASSKSVGSDSDSHFLITHKKRILVDNFLPDVPGSQFIMFISVWIKAWIKLCQDGNIQKSDSKGLDPWRIYNYNQHITQIKIK